MKLEKIKEWFGPWYKKFFLPYYDGRIFSAFSFRRDNLEGEEFKYGGRDLEELNCGNLKTEKGPLFRYSARVAFANSIKCAGRCNVTPHATYINVKKGRDKNLLENTCKYTCDKVSKIWTGEYTSIYSDSKVTRHPVPEYQVNENITCYCGNPPVNGVCENEN